VPLVLALVAGCTGGAPETGDDVVADAVADVEVVAGPLGALQDLWIVSRVQTVGADGATDDVLLDLVDDLRSRAEAPVELIPELAFHPVPSLAPTVLTALGQPREELDVVAGVLEVTDAGRAAGGIADDVPGATLAILASAAVGAVHVLPGDLLWLDVFELPALAGTDVALLDHAFAQSLPATDGTEPPLDDPVALLAHRWQDGRVVVGTPNGDAGEVALFTNVPLQRTDTVRVTPATWAPPSSTSAALVQTSASSDRPVPVVGGGGDGGGGGGFFPPKSRGELGKALISTLVCLGFAVAAGPAGAVVVTVICTAVTAASVFPMVFDMLDENPPRPKPPPRCSYPCARSSGDPHLSTFTGDGFSLQAAGEFTAARTDDGQLDVQVRLVPWDDRVAITGAVAVRAGEQRITVEHGTDEPLLLDGEPAGIDAFGSLRLDDGTMLERNATAIIVTWADGTELWLEVHRRGIDYRFAPTADLVPRLEGLHGTGDGRLLGADSVLRDHGAPHDVLLEHADTWRITEEEALFARAPGTTTDTWTDRSFPAAAVTLDDLDPDARARADTLCSLAGLTAFDLTACTIDVAVTGDPGYVDSAVQMQILAGPPLQHTLDPVYRPAEAVADGGATDDDPLDASALAWVRDDVVPVIGESGHEQLVVGDAVLVLRPRDGATAARDLLALELRDGTTRWELPEMADCTPAAVGTDRIAVLLADGDLALVSAVDGEVIASVESGAARRAGCGGGLRATPGGLVLEPVLRSGTAVGAAAVRAYDAEDGLALRWERTLDGTYRATIAIADGGPTVVEERDDRLWAHRLDPGSGATTASVDLGLPRGSLRPGDLSEVLLSSHGGDRVVVLGEDADGVGEIAVLDASGGGLALAWRTAPGAPLGSDRGFARVRVVASPTGDVLAGWVGPRLVLLDLADGATRAVHLPAGFENNRGAIAVAPELGVVLAPFRGAFLEVVDADGVLRWTQPAIGGLEDASHLGPVVDGRLLLAARRPLVGGADPSVVAAIDIGP
jgi:hypothetical protein